MTGDGKVLPGSEHGAQEVVERKLRCGPVHVPLPQPAAGSYRLRRHTQEQPVAIPEETISVQGGHTIPGFIL